MNQDSTAHDLSDYHNLHHHEEGINNEASMFANSTLQFPLKTTDFAISHGDGNTMTHSTDCADTSHNMTVSSQLNQSKEPSATQRSSDEDVKNCSLEDSTATKISVIAGDKKTLAKLNCSFAPLIEQLHKTANVQEDSKGNVAHLLIDMSQKPGLCQQLSSTQKIKQADNPESLIEALAFHIHEHLDDLLHENEECLSNLPLALDHSDNIKIVAQLCQMVEECKFKLFSPLNYNFIRNLITQL